MKFKLVDWQAKRAGAIVGTATVTFDDYLTVKITVLVGKNGLWAALPSRKWTNKQGKDTYDRLVEFADKSLADRFQKALLGKLAERYPEDFAQAA